MNIQDQKKKFNKNFLKIIIILILSTCVLMSIYLIGYKIGVLGVSTPIMAQLDVIKITSSSVDWDVSDNLNVFKNDDFNGKNIITPGSSGTYKFVVQNDSSENIKYDINFIESNKQNINMKYKIKIDNIYISGNKDTWKRPDEINMKDILITAGSKTIYTLEWLWDDTEEEKTENPDEKNYSISINFKPNWQR